MTNDTSGAGASEMLELLKRKLGDVYSETELQEKAELAAAINRLKRERKAVILGHNYMEPALFVTVPDFTGDSLGLSQQSAKAEADVILFCGVLFMAETAKILNPEKTVLIPSLEAGCSLAEGISSEDIITLKKRFPGMPVVTYVNTFATTKAECDYCCTSGNSSAVVRHLFDSGQKKVVFVPDEYLARNTAREMGVPFVAGWEEDGPAKAAEAETCIIGWNAHCEVHETFTLDEVAQFRAEHPHVTIVAHPECPPEVMEKIDVGGSTKKMIDYVRDSDDPEYLLLTESCMTDNVASEFPGKTFVAVPEHRCPYMDLITLENTLESLRENKFQVELPADVIDRAKTPIDRMLQIL